jgi:leucyl aminopeptidase
MDIRLSAARAIEWSGDLLAVGCYEDEIEMAGDLGALNDRLGGILPELIAEAEFKGSANSSLSSRVGGASPVKKVMLVGLGKREDLKLDTLRRAGATIARTGKREKAKSVGVSLPVAPERAADTAQVTAEGMMLAAHQDRRFKSEVDEKEKNNAIETVDLLGLAGQDAALSKGKAMAEGTILARELVAAPANVATPMSMAETAREIATAYGMTIKILEREQCEELGMGAFLGVAQASEMPPKFVHLTYTPKGTPRRKVAIVGKGLTFDSGGLNIKGAGSGIETMKMDMGGAAATFGAAKAIGQLQPDVEVHFISAITENMISGRAIHPGDILTASNGKTIEINNTDAEGRLTLADALVYTEKLEVDAIVDLATLTGACIIALGDNIAGLWSPQQELADAILAAAETAGEKFWQMPLEDKYFDGIKSPIADLKNTGPRGGGSITAALFLKQFIKDTPWAHLDVAGPVWADKEYGVNNAGATGYPVRTLVNWAIS